MNTSPEFDVIEGQRLSVEQRNYLGGFFSGLSAKGVTFGQVAGNGVAMAEEEPDLIREEKIKRGEHPLDSYYRLVANAKTNKAPDKDEVFRFKWHGLFFLNPVKDAFMARLRIPAGRLKTFQLRELASITRDLTSGYVQVTTRANLQIRLIEPKNAPEFLRRVDEVGLTTRGAGADNIRNLTTNPTSGIDPYELIDCTPFVRELAHLIINNREFYDLPRKFNIAFNGGGLIGSVEDTNDIGVIAVKGQEGVHFRVAAGGATGHKTFARDLGIVVAPADIVTVVLAMVQVYIANGNRGDRKKARLKHLLETWTLGRFVEATEKVLGAPLRKAPLGESRAASVPDVRHSHVGAFRQRQEGLSYLGVALPVGQVNAEQMDLMAAIADRYGSGEIRLTVWQNFIIPDIRDENIGKVKELVRAAGLDYQQSNIASGVIACTGNRFCKFSSTDTKGHAAALIQYLETRVALDVPVNIHFTGCSNSCAQHYMGDIGLLGAKAADGREAYHVCIGGGFAGNQAIGRQIYQAVPFEDLKHLVERILLAYLRVRTPGESFKAFAVRHETAQLQTLFAA
jgi:ferredoxin-nitrite reductase